MTRCKPHLEPDIFTSRRKREKTIDEKKRRGIIEKKSNVYIQRDVKSAG